MYYGEVLSEENIIFKDEEHKYFYDKYLQKCRYEDAQHKALVYCLGLTDETSRNVDRIYDFNICRINPRCLHEGWQTESSAKIVRMAFTLFDGGAPSVDSRKNYEEQIAECQRYTVGELFSGYYARYFFEAMRIRYQDECRFEKYSKR